MEKRQKSFLVLAMITAFITAGIFLPGLISGGDLEPPGPPATGTMHSLDEIYNKLEQLVPGGGLAPVAKTGQEISYGTGDDGDLQKGVTWPIPRFTDNSDGTVTDNLTGLIWLKNANCDGLKTWADALTFCNNLADGGCGLSDGSIAGDWRLPNFKEIHTLVDFSSYNPALPNGHPFVNVQSDYYWSSTTFSDNSAVAWRMTMISGGVDGPAKSASGYLWPVRGGN